MSQIFRTPAKKRANEATSPLYPNRWVTIKKPMTTLEIPKPPVTISPEKISTAESKELVEEERTLVG